MTTEQNSGRSRSRRRGHHEGTIQERRTPTGQTRFQAQISLPNGRRLTKTHATRRAALQWIQEAQKAVRDGAIATEQRDVRLGAFLERWLADVVKPSLRVRTYLSYRGLVTHHIAPELGHVKPSALRPSHVQALYARKAETLSGRTVQMLHTVLHSALKQAVRWGLVARNVCDSVERPRAARKEIHPLTGDQARVFLASILHHRFFAFYLLAVATGMRRGELCGLQWPDVDLERGRVYVRHSLQAVRGQGLVLMGVKSARGYRAIALPPPVVAALHAHRARQADEYAWLQIPRGNPDYVFTTVNGKPIEDRNLHRQFVALLDAAGLPRVRFHDLRHTAARLMLLLNVHPKVVQEMLGHSTISLTLDTYSHITPTLQADAAARMGDLLALPAPEEAEHAAIPLQNGRTAMDGAGRKPRRVRQKAAV